MNKNSSTRPVGRKLTIFMLFCLLSMCFSSIWAQNVTLSQHARPLRKVLGEIERQTGYKFFYNNSQVDVEKKVNVSSKKENLDKVQEKQSFCRRKKPLQQKHNRRKCWFRVLSRMTMEKP